MRFGDSGLAGPRQQLPSPKLFTGLDAGCSDPATCAGSSSPGLADMNAPALSEIYANRVLSLISWNFIPADFFEVAGTS
jgi:hypothetical protein